MTEPWGSYPPSLNAFRMEAGTGPMTHAAAATALTALAASFEIQQAVLMAHTGAMALLWPGLTVAAREAKISAYSAWLQAMVAECMRLSAGCVVVASSYTEAMGSMIPSATAIENRVAQATAVATNFMGVNTPLINFLDATYVEFWTQNAEAMSLYDAQVITAAAPIPKPPPPPLVNPAEPALDAAQQAVGEAARSAPNSIANQGQDAMKMMQPLQEAMSAPQQMSSQLMQPFKSAMSAPQQLMQQFMSGMNGMGNGGLGGSDGLSSYGSMAAFGGSAPTLSGGSMGGGLSGSAGGIGGLRPALGSSAGGGMTAMGNTQSLMSGPKSAIPAAGGGMPGMGGGGLGGAGMRGREGGARPQTASIEAGISPIADRDTDRANEILAQWLPKQSPKLD